MRLADGGVIRCALWGKAPRSPRERHRIADVPELADPLNQPFHSHPETRVLHAPVSAGIEVPFVGFRVLALFHEGLLNRLQVRLSFAPADDLADPVPPDPVEPEDQIGMLRVPRLIERLGDSRIVRYDDRLRLPFRQGAFLEGPEVLAPLEIDPLRLEQFQRVVVGHPLEGRLHGFQEVRRPAHRDDIVRTFLRDALARVREHALRVLDHVVHAGPGLLHLRMPVLRQVARRAGLLRAERRAEVVDLLHGEDEGLRIELPRLGQVSLAAEILHLEEGGAAPAPRGRDHGWGDLPESVVAEVLVDRAEDRVTDPEDRRHPLGTDPQMADVEEEFFALILLDRELLREVDDLEILRPDLVASGRSLVRDDLPADDDRGFDERLLRSLEGLWGDHVPSDRDLDGPRRVPNDDEGLPADRARPVDPASQLDGLARMAPLQDFLDGDHEPGSHPGGSRLLFRGLPRNDTVAVGKTRETS